MSANQACFPIAPMARVLGVSKAGYYAWLYRSPSAHAVADAALLKRVRTVHASSRQTYGAPRVHADLRAGGEKHGRKRIARLMRDAGLVGACHRRGGPATTQRDKEVRPAPDLVARHFTASGPNQLWTADITYIPTATGFLYLAVVLDVWSRKVVGWSMANHLRAELVLDALEMAVGQRRPKNVVHHSDQGSQGGIKWSSQHLDEEGCDEHRKAPFGSIWAGAVAFAWSTASGRTRRAAPVLGGDCDGLLERGCRGWGRCAAGCWNQMVPKGRRHATSNVSTIGEAAFRPVSLVSGTGGACDFACARLRSSRHCPTDRAVSVDGLARAATQCCDALWRSGVSGHYGAVAFRACSPAAKACEAGGQRGVAGLCARASGRDGREP